MKTAYIMIGIQGSGKSAFCRRYLSDTVRINLDTLKTRNNEKRMIADCHARGVNYVFGGVASGEHGIDIAKRHYFLRETPRENLAVMNRIKSALDPQHTLNDQKSYIVGGAENAELV